MKKLLLSIFIAGLLVIGAVGSVQAIPLDLDTFTIDGDVTVTGGVVTIDESSGLWSSYFYNDNFFVEADALSLSFDYELSSGIDDIDWLAIQVDYVYDLLVTVPITDTYTLDLTAYQNSYISLTLGLEADSLDWGYDSVATFSNFDLVSANNSQTPVPEPTTMLLFASGLVGLVVSKRKKQ